MRRTISKKDKGRNRITKIGLVLVFALLLSIYMTGGLLNPGTVSAASISDCGGCHIYNGAGTSTAVADGTARNNPAGLFPGSHGTHAGTGNTPGNLQYGFACTKCHVSNTTNNHRTGYIEMAQPINGDGSAAYSSGTVSFPVSNTFTPGTCTSVYCHSNGTGGTLNAGDPRPIAASTSPTWGGTATCSTCHGVGGDGSGQPNYASGSPKANSHAAHLPWNTTVSCYVCHSATVSNTSTAISSTVAHNDRTYDLAPVSSPTYTLASFTYSYSTSGGTCATNLCHAGQSTPKWGAPNSSPTGDWDCIGCHSYSFPKRLGIGTIRKVVGAGGDFNMSILWSSMANAQVGGTRHLFGATTIVKYDCIVCHREGRAFTSGPYTAGAVNWANHNNANGEINLRNVDAANDDTGFVVNNRRWSTIDYVNLDNFCVTCHDANGASAVSVNGTSGFGGNALMPFNSTDQAVSGQLKGSTNASVPRLRVVNVKDQFYPGTNGPGPNYNGNPSQHGVLGRRYSTVNPNWGTTWANYMLKKTGKDIWETKETSLLTCADCHVLDAGPGGNAHAGKFKYNLWSTTIPNVCWRCHKQAVYLPSLSAGAPGSRINHSLDSANWNGNEGGYGLSGNGNANAVNCLLCHASWNGTSTINRNFGGIHGSWSSVASYWNTVVTASWPAQGRTAYRFFPGALMRNWTPTEGGWNSMGTAGASCYFWPAGGTFNNNTPYSSCTSHTGRGGASVGTYQYNRSTRY